MEERIVQVRTFKLTTPTFVERALYGYQNWLKLVPSCRHFSSIIIGFIICIRHVAYPLSRSLKFHACINHLDLSHCDLGSSPEILLIILQSDVDNNNIDSLGAVKIAEYLESDPPIEHLSLDHNRLNDDDAILISQAMKRNTNLVSLYLDSNNFTSIGVKALLMCIFDSSSLNAISESNHTLTRIIFFTDTRSYTHIHNNDLVGCINRMFDLDKTQKLLIAMQMYQWN